MTHFDLMSLRRLTDTALIDELARICWGDAECPLVDLGIEAASILNGNEPGDLWTGLDTVCGPRPVAHVLAHQDQDSDLYRLVTVLAERAEVNLAEREANERFKFIA